MNNKNSLSILGLVFFTAIFFFGAGEVRSQTFTFNNTTSITVNDGVSEAAPVASTPYGTAISVSLCCAITRIEVSLNNITHDEPEDLEIKLVGPTGVAVDLFRDTGGGAVVAGQTWTFDDRDNALAPDAGPMATGTYKPTVVAGETGNLPAPAPAGVQSIPLSNFIGTSPNGTWTLYIAEDGPTGTGGTVAGGWSLSITVGRVFSAAGPITIPAGPGVAAPYPSTLAVSGVIGTVTKVSVRLNGFTHTFLDDVGILLVGPVGQSVRLTSDNGGNNNVAGDYVFDDTAANALPDDGAAAGTGNVIAPTTYRPTIDGGNHDGSAAMPADFPAPAPLNPYGTTLSVFDGVNPNGNWNLYIYDDTGGDSGTVASWTLIIEVLVPSAAPVSVSGRATTAEGIGIPSAILYLSGGGLEQPKIARTNPFGYYQFQEVPAGSTYLVEISSKRYGFAEPARVVTVNDNITDVDFVAFPK